MRFRFVEFVLAVVALVAMAYGFRHMITQGLDVVIASQPVAVKPVDTFTTYDWSGCDLGLGRSRAIVSKPCRFEPNSYTASQPFAIHQMSEADSKKAALWFSAAGVWPLAVGVVAVLILLMIRALAANTASRREFAAMERLAELGPRRDPFDRGKRL